MAHFLNLEHSEKVSQNKPLITCLRVCAYCFTAKFREHVVNTVKCTRCKFGKANNSLNYFIKSWCSNENHLADSV